MGSRHDTDPVKAPSDPATGDLDVAETIAAVLASGRERRLFWVFLDHQMTAGPLERVLDALAANHSAAIAAVNLDEALRLCDRDTAIRRCTQ